MTGKSRPPRARGLKQQCIHGSGKLWVAPPAGAWIETGYISGYKLACLSRPPRARGLKLSVCSFLISSLVAPPAGAWIETAAEIKLKRWISRAPRGRVD